MLFDNIDRSSGDVLNRGVTLLIHETTSGCFDDKKVRVDQYSCKSEEEATDLINKAFVDFCSNAKDLIDGEVNIHYSIVTYSTRCLEVSYHKDGEYYEEKLYITYPYNSGIIRFKGESK